MKLARLIFVSILGLASCASGNEFRVGNILIESPWARASAGRTATGVVYVRLANRGDQLEQLVSVATPVAGTAAVHETMRERGMMSMRKLETLQLSPGEVVSLAPGGLHIMLMRLGSPLAEGGSFPMTLTFEHAGAITIKVKVRSAGAMSAHAH